MQSRISIYALIYLCVMVNQGASAQELFNVLSRGGLQTYSVDGELLNSFEIATEFPLSVSAFAFDDAGTLYLSPPLSGGRIDRYSVEGNFLGTWATVDQSGVGENISANVSSLEFDANGLIYAGLNDTLDDRIERFSQDGSSLGIFAETTTDGFGGAIFDIEFDDQGRLYAIDRENVEWFDSSGEHLGVFATVPESGILTQLEFDSSGNLYVGSNDKSVHVFSPTGEEIRQFEIPHSIWSLSIAESDLLYISGPVELRSKEGFINAYDEFGNFQSEFLRIDDRSLRVLITTVPEPTARMQFCFAVAILVVSLKRKRRSR